MLLIICHDHTYKHTNMRTYIRMYLHTYICIYTFLFTYTVHMFFECSPFWLIDCLAVAWCDFLLRVVVDSMGGWDCHSRRESCLHLYGKAMRCDTGDGSHVVNKNQKPWIQSNRLAWEVSEANVTPKSMWCLACELRKEIVSLSVQEIEVFVEHLPFGSIWILVYRVVRFEKPLSLVLSLVLSGKFHKAVDAISFIPFLSDCSNCSSLLISIVALCSAWLA